MYLWPIFVEFIVLFLRINAKVRQGFDPQNRLIDERAILAQQLVQKQLEKIPGASENFTSELGDIKLQKSRGESRKRAGSIPTSVGIETSPQTLAFRISQNSLTNPQAITLKPTVDKEEGNVSASGSRNGNSAPTEGGIGAGNVSVGSDENNKTRKTRPSGINLALSLWLARLMRTKNTLLQPGRCYQT